MTRINTPMPTMVEWIQRNQEQITAHPAWRPISEHESEKLLQDKSPFTYLLRFGEKEHSYFISFTKEDGSIKHQFFVLELDRKGWYYRNGSTLNCPAEVVSTDINELIPLMMHCDLSFCNTL
jgi:hypothetical protein